MTRFVKVGTGGGETTWHRAMLDLRPGDVLLLEPGFYALPQGKMLADVTIKGLGASTEDTRITSFFQVDDASSRIVFENICLIPYKDSNTLDIPEGVDSFVIFRNCVLRGTGNKTTTLAISGKATVELIATKILNGTVSFFKTADFRLEMADSVIDYVSEEFGTLSLEGHGTAIINNSKITGTLNTFDYCNVELDIHNSYVGNLNMGGKTWLNMFKGQTGQDNSYSLYARGDCWLNIMDSVFPTSFCLADRARVLLHGSDVYSLQLKDDSQITVTNTLVRASANFEDRTKGDANRVTFYGNGDYQYFFYMIGKSRFKGRNLTFKPNGAPMLVGDEAKLAANALYSNEQPLEVECANKNNVSILGIKWTLIKK